MKCLICVRFLFQVSSLEDEKERAKNELESAEVDRLKTELSGLETQLTDRNKVST